MRKVIKKIFQLGGVDLRRYDRNVDRHSKLFDKYKSYTMIPRESFIQNLDLCKAFAHVSGAYVECGVWRGGMSGGVAEVIGKEKCIHLFDSFEGLPPAKEIDGKEAIAWQNDKQSPGYYDNCTAEEQFAINVMKLADHNNYKLHRGWFDQTTPGALIGPIGILRLDGDWYDSIFVCLKNLFPLVSEGGIVVLDDYYTWDGCTKAVHDYLSETKSPSRIYQWNNHVSYILKKS